MAADRHPKMRAMIMAGTRAARDVALGELLELQQGDFEGLFEVMPGAPVTIRLLDPPLHEFLPARDEIFEQMMDARLEWTGPCQGWSTSWNGCGSSRR